jgi:hypothetical protein
MMLATRWPSTRCTYHPALMASSAAGSLRSQCQHRPLPVEQIACRAPLTSRSEVLLALTSLILTSPCLRFHSVTLLESGRNRQPLRGVVPGCSMIPLWGFAGIAILNATRGPVTAPKIIASRSVSAPERCSARENTVAGVSRHGPAPEGHHIVAGGTAPGRPNRTNPDPERVTPFIKTKYNARRIERRTCSTI